MHTMLLALAGLLAAMERPAPADTTLRVTDLRTEYLATPVGTDVSRPRLSWRLASTRRNTVQTAYEVAVSTDSVGLLAGRSLLWSSGRVPSDASVFVSYGGPALRSATRYFWRVRVWDAGGASDWSTPSWWETGLLRPSDWSARWIRPPDAHRDSAGGPAPMLRRTFALDGPVRSARLYVTSLGLYEVELNGHRVGADASRPAGPAMASGCSTRRTTSPDCSPKAATRSAATLGDGWYRGHLGFNDRQQPLRPEAWPFSRRLEVRYADGRDASGSRTDSGWKAATGPILMSDIYGGETYDARLERRDGARPDTTTAGGIAARASPTRRPPCWSRPAGAAGAAHRGDTAGRDPAHSRRARRCSTSGRTWSGWVRLRVSGRAGTTVVLRHAEVLDRDGNFYTANLRNAAQTDRYTLKGGGDGDLRAALHLPGFRYVTVEGYPATPTLDDDHRHRRALRHAADRHVRDVGHDAQPAPAQHRLGAARQLPRRADRLPAARRAARLDRRRAGVRAHRGVQHVTSPASSRNGWPTSPRISSRTAVVPCVIPDVLSAASSTADAGAAGWADAAVIVPWTMYLAYGDAACSSGSIPSMRGLGRVRRARRRATGSSGRPAATSATGSRSHTTTRRLSGRDDRQGPHRHRVLRALDRSARARRRGARQAPTTRARIARCSRASAPRSGASTSRPAAASPRTRRRPTPSRSSSICCAGGAARVPARRLAERRPRARWAPHTGFLGTPISRARSRATGISTRRTGCCSARVSVVALSDHAGRDDDVGALGRHAAGQHDSRTSA